MPLADAGRSEPRYRGEYVFSGGLIDSVAEAGGDVEALASAAPHRPSRPSAHRACRLVAAMRRGPLALGQFSSSLPYIAYRCRTSGTQGILGKLLKRGGWEGTAFTAYRPVGAAWVLDDYAGRRDRPRLIYVADHEESLCSQIADSQPLFSSARPCVSMRQHRACTRTGRRR